MKGIKIDSSIALVPGLAIILSTLLAATLIFSFFSSINIANSQSFRLSSPSPFQSQSQQQLQQQQKPLNTDGTYITRNINKQQMLNQPFAISLKSSQGWSSLSQQTQHNQPPHKMQQQENSVTVRTKDSIKPDNDLSSMTSPKPTSKFPQPLCYFNMDPLFCAHYLWVIK